MATRYGRRAADGTIEYHDTKEALVAAEGRENSEARAGLFGLIGLLVGGVLTYIVLIKVGTDWPLLTGQDADLANVQAMLDGKQSMTVWKDTRKLGETVARMVGQIVKGETVEVNDNETYDNGKKIVPTYLVEPEVVTKDNVQSALVDSGFYSASDLGL